MNQQFKSALSVNAGVEKPPMVDPNALKRFLGVSRKPLTVDEYMEGILHGNRTLLSKAITLIESSLPEHTEMAQELVERCLPYAGHSVRIGITGVPGAGKSTFIENMGMFITTELHKKLAVLAIDPSSERSKGSILGDKTRMEQLSANPDAFIRPSPSAGSLGGVSKKTRESIILCEAAGFDTLFIETVGVGQSETAVHSMTDFFLLLMISGAGDELQGIKRGIMEMADMIVINKADGDNVKASNLAKAQYQNALHLFPKTPSGWMPTVLTCSSIYGTGIQDIWKTLIQYVDLTRGNGYFEARRDQQGAYWMYEAINDDLKRKFYTHPSVKSDILHYEKMVIENKISSFAAARKLVREYLQNTETE